MSADIRALALEQARRLAALGCSVIPVLPPVGDGRPNDGKLPAIPWRAFQTRHATDAELATWFGGEPMNIGLVTGAISDVVVVDCDETHALRWWTKTHPYTHWQTRTSRGFHLFYRHPGVPVSNRSGLETSGGRLPIDVRADGGYVLAPGSVHASGHVYVAAGDWTMSRAVLPRFSPRWMARPAPARRSSSRPAPRSLSSKDSDVLARARRYLAAIPKPEIGHGSDRDVLYAACRLVRGFALSESDAAALLWDWAGHRPGWTFEWVQAKVTHALRYGRESIGGLVA